MSWCALYVKTKWFGILLAGGLIASGVSISPVAALEDTDSEKESRKACEAKICRLVVDKPEPRGALTCDLGRTWGKAKIKEGADTKQIKWAFGDARCKLDVAIPQTAIINALTKPKFTFNAPPHTVECDVEMGSGIKPVRAVLAPKLKFEDGRLKKLWVGLKEIDGPGLLTSLVWTTAKLEDTLGIFHKEMVKEVNKFLHKTCAEEYGPDSAKSGKEGKPAQSSKAPEKKADDKKSGAKTAEGAKAADGSQRTDKPAASKDAPKPKEDARKSAKPDEAKSGQAMGDIKGEVRPDATKAGAGKMDAAGKADAGKTREPDTQKPPTKPDAAKAAPDAAAKTPDAHVAK